MYDKKTYRRLFSAALLVWMFTAAPLYAEFIADGVKLVQLTDNGKSRAGSWAYHGDLISYVYDISDTQHQLMIMKSDGTGSVKVGPIGNPFFAEWSWAGDKLSYEFSNAADQESQSQVFVYHVKTDKSIPVSGPYPRYSVSSDDGPFFSADDRHVAYQVRVGPALRREMWVADVYSGKTWKLLPERECKDQQWSPINPGRLSMLVSAAGEGYDLATIDLDGGNMIMLTDIGAQDVNMDRPRWSLDGKRIAFKNDQDLTKTEQEKRCEDCWVAMADGTNTRNITNSTTPATEFMLNLYTVQWTWDNQWIISQAIKYDKHGNSVHVLYKIDPETGDYDTLRISTPRENGEIEYYRTHKISYDSTKIAYVITRSTVRNWGAEPQYENSRWVLGLYDLKTGKDEDLLVFHEQLDRKEIAAGSLSINSPGIENISWSPDSRSILLTIANVISDDDDITEPDIYRLDLPDRLIDISASKYDGPPQGRNDALLTTEPVAAPAQDTDETVFMDQKYAWDAEYVTEVIKPRHITLQEASDSLSDDYQNFLTTNTTRNMFIFKGPPEALRALKSDLKLIDTEPPHILVDLLAVELSDEANRSLGLDWTYAEGHVGLFQPSGMAIRDLTPDPGLNGMTTFPGLGQSFYQGVGTLPREFFIRLNTLVSNGSGKILANPRTVATSGKQSLIQIRKTQNFFFNEGFDTAGRPIVKKSDIASDTQGQITPTLLPDGKIHLVVDVGVGTYTFTTAANLPEQTTRKANTEVTVAQGETIVLGGLRQQEVSKVEKKVPILGDIPILGWLFKQQQEEVTNSVLTIFITPQLMNGNLTPDWPQLDPEQHKIVPIMPVEINGKHKKNK